ncbi:MAG: hypothetical protein KGH71_03405 [Candidatus Micrarchaeota archaeon]|nr:hypothetical protein [Candidatus Micrarchaeota archaeon]
MSHKENPVEVPILKNNSKLNLGEAVSANSGNPAIGQRISQNSSSAVKIFLMLVGIVIISIIVDFILVLLLAFSGIPSTTNVLYGLTALFFIMVGGIPGFLQKRIFFGAVLGFFGGLIGFIVFLTLIATLSGDHSPITHIPITLLSISTLSGLIGGYFGKRRSEAFK